MNNVPESKNTDGEKSIGDELSRLKRTLNIFGECNRALAGAVNERALLDQICSIIIETGGYPLAWVGYPEPVEPYRLLPVSAVGPQTRYLKDIFISWKDNEFGQAPAALSIRSGQAQLSSNAPGDPAFKHWNQRVLDSGLASVVALPLKEKDQNGILGTLVIYSNSVGAFSREEVDLFASLADNLAYVIFSLRKQASHAQVENALAEQQQLLRTLMDSMPDTIYVKDENSRFLLANQAILKLMNAATTDDLLYKTDFDFYPADLAQKYHQDEMDIIRSGQPMINMIEPIIPEDGQVRWYLSTKIPFRDQHGRVKGIVGIGRDITQIKNMEADLQKAHDELEERVEQRTLELKKVNQQLAGLYEISQAITAPLQLDLVLNEIAQRTAELMGSDTGVIMLLDGEGESLSIRGAYGVSEEMAKIIHHQIGESVSGCVAQSGQALLVNNLRENAVFYNENAK